MVIPVKISNKELIDSKRNGWTVLWSGKGLKYDGSVHRSLVCMCMCGRIKEIRTHDFLTGRSKNCGCFRECGNRKYSSHTSIRRAEYGIWKSMRRRCHNPNDSRYYDYGGRGISVCKEWRESFQNFYDSVGPRLSDKHTIDRIDNNGNYEPGNVRWATVEEQYRNKRNTRMLTYNDLTKTIAEWSRIVNIPPNTIRGRIEQGWTIHDAFTKPIMGRNNDNNEVERIWNEINDLGNGDFDKGVKEYILNNSDMYLLEEDGVSHLNIYSRGKTELGRFLSNFALSPFTHPKFGSFNTIEGFWQYIKTGKKHECFRTLSGMDCKKISKQYEKQDCDNFQRYIKEAILLKIESNEKFKLLLKESTLPLTHYYYYGDQSSYKIIIPDNNKWVISYIEDIRKYLNNKALKLIIAGSRSIEDYDKLKDIFNTLPYPVIEIVDGMARHGVDMLGVKLANELSIPLKEFPADWDKYKKPAGMIRNKEMSVYANGLLALWNGVSPGTKDIINRMKKKKLIVHELKL